MLEQIFSIEIVDVSLTKHARRIMLKGIWEILCDSDKFDEKFFNYECHTDSFNSITKYYISEKELPVSVVENNDNSDFILVFRDIEAPKVFDTKEQAEEALEKMNEKSIKFLLEENKKLKELINKQKYDNGAIC
jgi:hypothetical protein